MKPYTHDTQFELSSNMCCFLADPIPIEKGHVFVYSVSEDGTVKTGIERDCDE